MSGNLTPAQQEAYMNNVKLQIQTQMMQELMNKVSDSCFKVCAGKRGDGLDSSEKYCMSNCFDRYQDTMNIVAQSLVNSQGR